MTEQPTGLPTTDAEIVHLLQEKTPDELTAEELACIRDRMQTSAELRDTLFSQLQFESHLSAVLAPVSLSPDEIIARAEAEEQTGRKSRFRLLHWAGVAFALVVGIGLFVANGGRAPQPPRAETLVADADDPDVSEPAEKTDRPTAINEADVEPPGEVVVADANAAPDASSDADPDVVPEPNPEAVPEAPPDVPWFAATNADAVPIAFEDRAIPADPTSVQTQFLEDDFKRWFTAVKGQKFGVAKQTAWPDRTYVKVDGVARLRAPLVENAVAEFTPFETDQFRISFVTGGEAVQFRWLSRSVVPHWVAYRFRPDETAFDGELTAVLATDGGAYERTNGTPVQLRWQQGRLVLTSGEIVLLAVPFANPPETVDFTGRFSLMNFEMWKGTPVPISADSPRPQRVIDNPADEMWQVELADGTSFVAEQDGSVTLSASHWAEFTRVWLPVDLVGFADITFEVEGLTTGADVFLGDADGTPLHIAGAMTDRSDDRTVLAWRRRGEAHLSDDYNEQHDTQPVVPDGVLHLRLRVGSEVSRLEVSPDGERFSPCLYRPWRHDRSARVGSVGIMLRPSNQPRSITLRRVGIGEWKHLELFAARATQARAADAVETPHAEYGAWLANVYDARPDDIEIAEWLRACALQTLRLYSPSYSETLMWELLDQIPHVTETASEAADLIDALALQRSTWEGTQREPFVRAYAETATRLASREGAGVVAELTRRALLAPWVSHPDVDLSFEDATRVGLLRSIHDGDTDAVAELVRIQEFIRFPSHAHAQQNFLNEDEKTIRGFANAWLGSQDAELASRVSPLRIRSATPPLIPAVNKEGYNTIAEFESALRDRAFDDAVNIVSSLGSRSLSGLLPDSRDPLLFRSMPNTLAHAMDTLPELQTAMREQLGPVALLRVREAIGRGDVERVQSQTLRYYGTEAASEAHHWLGDRLLADGAFDAAAEHFLLAQSQVPPGRRADLASRIALVSALRGTPSAQGEATSFRAGETTLNAAEFGSLVERVSQSRGKATSSTATSVRPIEFPVPDVYRLARTAPFEGQYGQKLSAYKFRMADWSGKQFAAVSDGKRIYANNRIQMTAYDAKSGAGLWTRAVPGGEQGEAHGWTFTRAVPLVIGDRVYVRRLVKEGFELACLSADAGNVLFRKRSESGYAAGPVLVRGRLCVVEIVRSGGRSFSADLVFLDLATGAELARETLARFRDEWSTEPPAGIAVSDEAIVVSVGGSLIGCDPLGRPRWQRIGPWLHPDFDASWSQSQPADPLVVGNTVFTTDPEVKSVSAVDAVSGSLLWSVPVPRLERMLGVSAGIVVCVSTDAVFGLDATNGSTRWSLIEPDVCEATAFSDDRLCLFSVRTNTDGKKARVLAHWIDLRSGRRVSTSPLTTPDDLETTRIGPFVQGADRLFLFAGHGGNTGRRDLCAFERPSDVALGPVPHREETAWDEHLTEWTREVAAYRFPGWRLLTRQHFAGRFGSAALLDEHFGERHVLTTRVGKGIPVRFAREVGLPAEQPASLKLRVGHDEERAWELRVLVDGQLVQTSMISPETASGGWTSISVDLTPWSGKQIALRVEQHVPEGQEKPGDAFWADVKLDGPEERP